MGGSGCEGVGHYGMVPRGNCASRRRQAGHACLDVRRHAAMHAATMAVGSHTQKNSDAMTCHPRWLKKRAPIGDTTMG